MAAQGGTQSGQLAGAAGLHDPADPGFFKLVRRGLTATCREIVVKIVMVLMKRGDRQAGAAIWEWSFKLLDGSACNDHAVPRNRRMPSLHCSMRLLQQPPPPQRRRFGPRGARRIPGTHLAFLWTWESRDSGRLVAPPAPGRPPMGRSQSPGPGPTGRSHSPGPGPPWGGLSLSDFPKLGGESAEVQ